MNPGTFKLTNHFDHDFFLINRFIPCCLIFKSTSRQEKEELEKMVSSPQA